VVVAIADGMEIRALANQVLMVLEAVEVLQLLIAVVIKEL
jgi:hypothetical protein